MKTKLTLSLDESVIDQAKAYAAAQQTSLSRLIEEFLRTTSLKKPKAKVVVSEYVKSLATDAKLPKSYDLKREYAKHVAKRYGL
ncbi:MAG: hypothetical protein IPL86_16700 [Flavobacteriales bacterium]|nr:hypothetical protein [Flavobacteriales bacterium]